MSLVALIVGYTILIPNEKTDGKDSPLAVMLQSGQTYTKSIIKNFSEVLDDYDYDHIDYGYAVRPTVYLSSEVYITLGSGTMLDPYTIAM